jgi:hypothetical protein
VRSKERRISGLSSWAEQVLVQRRRRETSTSARLIPVTRVHGAMAATLCRSDFAVRLKQI